MTSLEEFYRRRGLDPTAWHIGDEHPRLEDEAIALLSAMPRAHVLEIGYQAGGFAVPVIMAMRERPDFAYVGVDSLAYRNAVDGGIITDYLASQGVHRRFEFLVGDARQVLAGFEPGRFDMVLIDHHKPLYPREMRSILACGLTSPCGALLLHDVLGKARDAWRACTRIARAYGQAWRIVEGVPGGLALVQRDDRARWTTRRALDRLLVDLRYGLLETLRDARRALPLGRTGVCGQASHRKASPL